MLLCGSGNNQHHQPRRTASSRGTGRGELGLHALPQGPAGRALEPSIPHRLMLQNKTEPNRGKEAPRCTNIIVEKRPGVPLRTAACWVSEA